MGEKPLGLGTEAEGDSPLSLLGDLSLSGEVSAGSSEPEPEPDEAEDEVRPQPENGPATTVD